MLQRGALIVDDIPGALSHFENTIYSGKKPKPMNRAIRQMKSELADNKHYDVTYVGDEYSESRYTVNVVDQGTGEVVKSFDENTRFPNRIKKFEKELDDISKKVEEQHMSKIKQIFLGAKFVLKGIKEVVVIKLFRPIEALPDAFRAAAHEATVLDKQALRQEANVKKVNQIFNEG